MTRRQRELLAYIQARIAQEGQAPTVREAVSDLGLSSTRLVNERVTALQEQGFVIRTPDHARNIMLGKRRAPPLPTFWRNGKCVAALRFIPIHDAPIARVVGNVAAPASFPSSGAATDNSGRPA